MDAQLKGFLRHHWEEVAQRSGQPFSYELLDREDFVYDTEPAARAVVLAKQLAPERSWEMFTGIQHAFYAENRDTNELETYLELAEKLGIDRQTFAARFVAPAFAGICYPGRAGGPTEAIRPADLMGLILLLPYFCRKKRLIGTPEKLNRSRSWFSR